MKRIKEKIYKIIPNISSNILVLSIMIAIIALMGSFKLVDYMWNNLFNLYVFWAII